MATIKFDHQDELESLIARLYLDTSRKLSKKELLEIIFEIATQDYHLLVKKVQEPKKNGDVELRTKFIANLSGALSVSDADVDTVDPKAIWEKAVE